MDQQPRVDQSIVALLGRDSDSTRVVYHALRRKGYQVKSIIEEPESRFSFVRRRVRRIGLMRTSGQLLFRLLIVPLLAWCGESRRHAILAEYELETSPIPKPFMCVKSINDVECHEALRRIQPSVVVVSGTRILQPATLMVIPVPIINMHAGITPMYRGVHGAYWALYEKRPDLVGTTIHLIDKGIDTGGILAQVTFTVTRKDNFSTYPYLHLGAGLPALLEIVNTVLQGKKLTPYSRQDIPSRLRYHPTAWEYCRTVAGGGPR